MDKLFEIPLLDDLYINRCEELENQYINVYGMPKERKQFLQADDTFTELFNEVVKGPDELQKLSDGFLEYTRYALQDSEFWRKQNYKQGFCDGICLMKEFIHISHSADSTIYNNSQFSKIITEFITYLNQKSI